MRERACAKVNMTLRVGEKRGDGYHPLRSMVVFAQEVWDEVEVVVGQGAGEGEGAGGGAGESGFVCEGEEAGGLVAQAAGVLVQEGVGVPPMVVRLHKNIPIEAGLGGGSADVGAFLRLLVRQGVCGEAMARKVAVQVGSDVLVCFLSKAAMVAGRGEVVEPLPAWEKRAAVVVVPKQRLATRDVFAALEGGRVWRDDAGDLAASGNDLEAPARMLASEVGEVLAALGETKAQVVRMSGSGSACFGLYGSMEEAEVAAQMCAGRGKGKERGWWVRQTWLGDGV